MALVINVPVEFTFNLEAYPLPGSPPAAVSLVMVDGAGNTLFDQDGANNGAVYTPPTDTVQGSYIFTYTFPTKGNWSIILADGIAGNFLILHRERANIIAGDPFYIRQVAIHPDSNAGTL